MKDQHAPEVHREVALLNTDNEFNRAINEEDIDFDIIREAGDIELCELLDVQPKAQCKICLSYWDVGIAHCTCGHFLRDGTEGEQEIRQVHSRSPLDSQLLHQERATPRAPLREEAGGSRVLHREFAQEEMQEETVLGYSRPVHP